MLRTIENGQVEIWCDRRGLDRIVEFSKLATIHRASQPQNHRPLDEFALVAAPKWNQRAGRQVTAPSYTWTSYSPRPTGISRFAVLAELVDHKISAIRNSTRERWGHAAAGAPTWLMAHTRIAGMIDIGIGPVQHNLKAFAHQLMATPGPHAFAYDCSEFKESQARDVFSNRYIDHDSIDLDNITAMLNYLNSQGAQWFYLAVTDTDMAQYGACVQLSDYSLSLIHI